MYLVSRGSIEMVHYWRFHCIALCPNTYQAPQPLCPHAANSPAHALQTLRSTGGEARGSCVVASC